MHTFYNCLSDLARAIIDASVGDALMKKTTDQAYEILEDTTLILIIGLEINQHLGISGSRHRSS